MTIDLPSTPAPADAVIQPVDFGAVLTPALGGALQRINRLGNRHQVTFTMPPMYYEPHGRVWAARLVRAQTVGGRMRFFQPGVDVGTPGSPVIDGSGQIGSTISLRGLTAGYKIREGQAFSVVRSGRHYVLVAGQDITANGSGEADVPLTQMIRVLLHDGDVCHFDQPMIEGLLTGDAVSWALRPGKRAEGFSFTITEVA